MDHPVTLVHPEEPTPGAPSFALPDDLLEQMRGRVRLLALLMLAAFAIDPILFFGAQALAKFQGRIIPDEVQRDAAFYWCDVAVVVVSAGLWLLARSSRISVTRLRAIGLGYEVVLCFVVAFRTIGEYYRDLGMLPNLTWAPAIVILFPLIMPAPPRLMLPAALAAGSMPLLALVALQSLAQVPVDGAYMFNTAMGSAIAIGFAWMGSRVVYGLGREVELFDFGVAQDGAFYYVMELLDGLDADRLVRRYGPVPPERAIYLLRQICHSLSEAESRGLVHRDIKPANVFLCHYGEEYDFVKVLDFGIVTAPGGSVEPAITRDAHVQGTPAFIAPEQALGEPLDGRADIYATGCVAYWLLTGEFVFTADTTMGLLVQHARSQPDPPSTRTTLPIPRALEELILCCLAKKPAHRPQSARELSRRLGGIGEARPWTPERAESWWREHRPSS